MTSESDELQRIRTEYTERRRRLDGSDLYSFFNPANLFIVQQRQRTVLSILRREGFYPLANRLILEVGCGGGGILLEYLNYGVTPNDLYGTELLFDRIKEARSLLPHLPLTCADGQHLPYVSGIFDLVLQYTVFSSILDEAIKYNLAKEMLRVLRKPGGMIIWYDFWLNPKNPQTQGIRVKEIRQLFPDCQLDFHQVTLAPPITRRLIRVSWLLCCLLEKLRLFNTHYLVAIRPNTDNNKQ